jgi:NADH:ubiquinone oxidoreductase subunit 4 (subunit M)
MHPLLALAAGLSIPITVAYILNANNKVFMERDEPAGGHGYGHSDEHSSHPPLPPITLPEYVAAIILMALLVIVGLCPSIMLNMIKANVELFLRGGQ